MKALAAEEHSELHDRARVPYILCYIWTTSLIYIVVVGNIFQLTYVNIYEYTN